MLIAIDIGTTNIKAVAVSGAGNILAVAERQNATLNPQTGWQEQDPEAVFQYVVEVLAEVWAASKEEEKLSGIIFSSAMHGLMAVDKNGKPLTNILLWSDMRADAIARSLRQGREGLDIYRRTGVPIHAMSPLCKLMWLRQSQPDVFQKAHQFLDIKSYVWFRLTGEFRSDVSVASATGLLNIEQQIWDAPAMEMAGIAAAQLPKPVSPAYIAGVLPEMAAKWALPTGVPYMIGASDGALANIGSGATETGQIAVTIGTSAAIRTVSARPLLDASMRTFCYRLDDKRFIVGGASNNGANALEWLRHAVFQSPLSAEAFANQAVSVPAAADGLLFLPYLLGERAPLYNAQVCGSFQDMTARHGQAHFVRAAMEGVLFNVKIIAEALETHSPIDTLHVGGGFSRNPLWVQMLADIFQKTVILPDEQVDASLLGALRFAGQMLGLNQTGDSQKNTTIEPNTANALVYEEAYQRFKTLVFK